MSNCNVMGEQGVFSVLKTREIRSKLLSPSLHHYAEVFLFAHNQILSLRSTTVSDHCNYGHTAPVHSSPNSLDLAVDMITLR